MFCEAERSGFLSRADARCRSARRSRKCLSSLGGGGGSLNAQAASEFHFTSGHEPRGSLSCSELVTRAGPDPREEPHGRSLPRSPPRTCLGTAARTPTLVNYSVGHFQNTPTPIRSEKRNLFLRQHSQIKLPVSGPCKVCRSISFANTQVNTTIL